MGIAMLFGFVTMAFYLVMLLSTLYHLLHVGEVDGFGKLLWAIALLCAPYIGCLIYYLVYLRRSSDQQGGRASRQLIVASLSGLAAIFLMALLLQLSIFF